MMNLVRREPRFGWGLMNLRDEVDKMFRDLYENGETDGRWLPSVDITEDKDRYEITVEIPGVKKEDVKVNIHDNVLTIEGEKKGSTEKKEGNNYRSERYFGKFSRSFTLNSEIDADKVKADFDNGVLKIALPKSEKIKPRQITIN